MATKSPSTLMASSLPVLRFLVLIPSTFLSPITSVTVVSQTKLIFGFSEASFLRAALALS